MTDTSSLTEKQDPAEIIAGVLAERCFDPPSRFSKLDHARMHNGDAAEVIGALRAAGYVIVPREPTEEMLAESKPAHMGTSRLSRRKIWAPMVEAAGG